MLGEAKSEETTEAAQLDEEPVAILRAEVEELRARLAAREQRAELELQATAAFWISKLAEERQKAHDSATAIEPQA